MNKTDYPRHGTRKICAYYKRQERKAFDHQGKCFWNGCYAVSKQSEQEMRHLKWAETSDH